MMNFIEMICISLISSFISYILIAYAGMVKLAKAFRKSKAVLFVIAHPDDECMFFGPTIMNLCNSGCCVYLLCLSAGEYYSKACQRKEELRASCKILGIPAGNVTIVQHSKMPDSPYSLWRDDLVAGIVQKYVEQISADAVITFDKKGISGHLNHTSIYNGLKYLCKEGLIPKGCQVYLLETVNILRKYTSFIDVPLSYLFAQIAFVSTYREVSIIRKSMKAHYSQLVWFRKLYIIFSRYMFINTFKEMYF